MRPETIAIHSGAECDAASHAAAAVNSRAVSILEQRVSDLECGTAALAAASSQTALHGTFFNIADGGGNIVATPQLCGTARTLLADVLPQAGIIGRFAADDSAEAMAARIDGDTKALFCESIGNPAGNIADIEAFARIAHAHGIPLIVDNSLATPMLMRPFDHGADIVVHSLTEFMGGNGAAMGATIVESGCFDWMQHAARFPQFVPYAERFPDGPFTARARSLLAPDALLSPRSAFRLLQGLENLALRVERRSENAQSIAEYLESHPAVAWVDYAGLKQSRHHALARKYFDGCAPSLLTFGVKGGYETAKRFYKALKLIKRLAHIGEARTLACHPASTTHSRMAEAEQRRAGVTPETIRLSVGVEHKDDIIADIAKALASSHGLKLVRA